VRAQLPLVGAARALLASWRAAVQGCLQDIHWAMGALGYFTTYTLGAMYAAQIFYAAKKDLPNLEQDVAAGKFSQLREWLREKVHKRGSVPSDGDELMKAVTGEPLNVSIFLKYLRDKYHALYKL
jgi:carboxypeptidase Taq